MKLSHILISFLWIGFIAIGWVFLKPRTYDVLLFSERKGTQYWDLNTGSKIGYFKINGKSEIAKTPIIYLHGGPGGLIKDETIEALKPLADLGHDLYFYDQIGSGHSERLENIKEYSLHRHIIDLKEIIDRITTDKIIIIGHSWGSMLAIELLQCEPAKVEKLILEGPGPILPINTSLIGVVPADSLNLINPDYSNKEGNQKAYNLRMKFIDKWAYLFNKKWASDQEVDDFFTYLNGELSKSTFCNQNSMKPFPGGGGYYSHIMTVRSFRDVENKKERLKKIHTPTLLIRGQCDNQKWGFTKEYLDLLPNSNLVIIKNAGHNLIGANKEKYLQEIEEFLSTPLN